MTNWEKLVILVERNQLDNPVAHAIDAIRLERDRNRPVIRVVHYRKRNFPNSIKVIRRNGSVIELQDTEGEIGVESNDPSFRITRTFFEVIQHFLDDFVV